MPLNNWLYISNNIKHMRVQLLHMPLLLKNNNY